MNVFNTNLNVVDDFSHKIFEKTLLLLGVLFAMLFDLSFVNHLVQQFGCEIKENLLQVLFHILSFY